HESRIDTPLTREIGEDHAMDRGFAVLIMALVGGCIALQAPINAGLGKATGSMAAALVSFSVGTLALATVVVLSDKAGGLTSTFDVSWYYLLGGFLGALYVLNALVAVSAIGAGGVAAATVFGQLTASVAIDRLGLFGLDEVALSPQRVLGVALLLAGTVLVVR
ncbi:MAG TPA: DMT family transporter, partial [Solirubrobacterales bacterium]|nr:DMT family transporter [Solirubrobacterales bacterium]